jgi:hypothetical protein
MCLTKRYATIPSSTTLKGPDAIQLACAGEVGVGLFVTNDHRLQGKQVDGFSSSLHWTKSQSEKQVPPLRTNKPSRWKLLVAAHVGGAIAMVAPAQSTPVKIGN